MIGVRAAVLIRQLDGFSRPAFCRCRIFHRIVVHYPYMAGRYDILLRLMAYRALVLDIAILGIRVVLVISVLHPVVGVASDGQHSFAFDKVVLKCLYFDPSGSAIVGRIIFGGPAEALPHGYDLDIEGILIGGFSVKLALHLRLCDTAVIIRPGKGGINDVGFLVEAVIALDLVDGDGRLPLLQHTFAYIRPAFVGEELIQRQRQALHLRFQLHDTKAFLSAAHLAHALLLTGGKQNSIVAVEVR